MTLDDDISAGNRWLKNWPVAAAVLAVVLFAVTVIFAQNGDSRPKPAEEVVLKSEARDELLRVRDAAIVASRVLAEARLILTDSTNPCEQTVLKRFDTERVAKVNAWQALETGTRYLLKVEPTWELDLEAGKYRPRKP